MTVTGRWTAVISLTLAGAAICGCDRRVTARADVAWDSLDAVIVQVDIIPMEGEAVLRDHAVAVREGRIAWIGPAADVPRNAAGRRIEGAGR